MTVPYPLSGRRADYPPSQLGVSYAAAQRRIKEGYVLPELPTPVAGWTAELQKYVEKAYVVLKQRAMDSDTINDTANYPAHSRALMVYKDAMTRKDHALIQAFHGLIMEVSNPEDIELAMNASRFNHPCARLTAEHLEAYGIIKSAYGKWRGSKPLWSNQVTLGDEEMMFVLARICFEDVSVTRANAIATLLDRDIVEESALRDALEGFSGVETPLLEGAL